MKKNYFLILSIFTVASFAQNYNYTVYDTSNSGIASNYISDLKVDTNGLLWISTIDGVSTFNGSTFSNYNTNNSGIASNSIFKIEIDGLGRKWMATPQSGIILFDGTNWINYTTGNSGIPTNVINDIAVDGLNNLWIASTSGLTKFNGTTWTTFSAQTDFNSVATDSSNGVWVTPTSSYVLYKFNGTDFDFMAQGTEKILKIKNDRVYCSNGANGFLTLPTSGTPISFVSPNNSCLSGYTVKCLDVDNNSKEWIAINGEGLQNFTNCISYTNTNSGLPDNYFNTLRTEATGTIWLGHLQLGLVKMSPILANEYFTLASNVKAYPNPIKDNLTLSLDTEINEVSIYNILGKEVITKSLNSNEGTIDTSSLLSGTYLVKVTSNDGVKTLKVIKE